MIVSTVGTKILGLLLTDFHWDYSSFPKQACSKSWSITEWSSPSTLNGMHVPLSCVRVNSRQNLSNFIRERKMDLNCKKNNYLLLGTNYPITLIMWWTISKTNLKCYLTQRLNFYVLDVFPQVIREATLLGRNVVILTGIVIMMGHSSIVWIVNIKK